MPTQVVCIIKDGVIHCANKNDIIITPVICHVARRRVDFINTLYL